MAKDNGLIKTALIVGGLGAGAYFLFKKNGITDKIGDGMQSFTDSVGEQIQHITDTGGAIAQKVTDTGGAIAQTVGDTAKKFWENSPTKKAIDTGQQVVQKVKDSGITDTIGATVENTANGLGRLMTGNKDYKWTGFKWPWK